MADSGEIWLILAGKCTFYAWVGGMCGESWLKPESAESAGFCKIVSPYFSTPCSTLQVGGGFKRSAHSAVPDRCHQSCRPRGLFRVRPGGHLRSSGGLPGPPPGAILGPPGAFLGLLIFKRSRKEPESPSNGPEEGPAAEQKVLQEGFRKLVADLRTRI